MNQQKTSHLLTPEKAMRELWSRGSIRHKLHPVQRKMLQSYLDSKSKTTVITCARRLGKCLAEGTEVLTPTGPVYIEDLQVGDVVYGFNSDGSVSPTTVLAVEFQGEKEVVELINHNRVLAESTEDHRWGFTDSRTGKFEEHPLKEVKNLHNKKIARRFVSIPGGNVRELHAYAIGALLGDGCSKQGSRTTVYLSSENELIPAKVSGIVGAEFHRNSTQNYTWNITYGKWGKGFVSKSTPNIHYNYYNEWCKDRYAHEKIIDLAVIKTWDRTSRLELLAGLIDTDGSVGVNGNILTIQFGSQSMSIMAAVQYLIHSLVQYKVKIIQDKRTKYVNGPYFSLSLRNNLISKKLLLELDAHLITPRKKWKQEYQTLNEHNARPDYVGVKKGNKRITRTWDIQVSNETSLYLLANGLVTHNSYLLCILASEKCMQQPGSIVKYLCPVKKQVKTVIHPIMDEIFKDCPPEMRPEFKQNDYMYVFPNGSQIQMAGTDGGHHESLRGGKSDMWIIDEAGFCTDLSYVIRSILAPTTLTTGGRGILASTPSKSPDHEFIVNFVKPAEFKKELIKYTIYDNPLIDEKTLQEVIDEFPSGIEDPEFKREYLCEIVRGESSVIPEFTREAEKDIVKEVTRPPFFDSYVSMDIGFRDQTAVLFGYWDFKNAALVIEDEFIQDGETLLMDKFALDVRKKEEKLWTSPISGEFKAPYMRVADNNNQIMLNQLTYDHNLMFIPTRKDQKEAAIATLRLKIANRQIIIHPRCETLIYHLQNATWDKKGKNFTRSPDGSHYDCLDALIYMMRNVSENKNPYPAGYGIKNTDFFTPDSQKKYTKSEEAWINIFKTRSSLKRN